MNTSLGFVLLYLKADKLLFINIMLIYGVGMEKKVKKEYKEFIFFICGLIMLVIGLYSLSEKVDIKSSLFLGIFYIEKIKIYSIFVLIPLLIGIVICIVKPDLLAGKIIAACGLILICILAIVTTSVEVVHIEWYLWLFFLGLVIIGLALIIDALISMKKDNNGKIK